LGFKSIKAVRVLACNVSVEVVIGGKHSLFHSVMPWVGFGMSSQVFLTGSVNLHIFNGI